MDNKLYKTPNGKTFDEAYLREEFGDKFGLLVATGQLEEIENPPLEEEVIEDEIYLTPNGQEFTTTQLIEEFGPNGFEQIKDQLKKKNQDGTFSDSSFNLEEALGVSDLSEVEPPADERAEAVTVQDNQSFVNPAIPPGVSEEDAAIKIQQDIAQNLEETEEFNIAEAEYDSVDRARKLDQDKANKEFAKKQKETEQALENAGIQLDEDFKSAIQLINKDLVLAEQDEAAKAINGAFGKYGINAYSTGILGRDTIVIQNFDGTNSITVEVDEFTDAQALENSKKIRDFITLNAMSVEDNYTPEGEDEDLIRKAFRAKESRPVGLINDDGTMSTHKFMQYEEDGKFYVVPTVFPRDPENMSTRREDWFKLDMDDSIALAKLRGEVYEFETEDEAQDFAEGAWKDVSTVDLEGQRFYQDRGLDYNSARVLFDNYEAARDERIFLENVLAEAETVDKYGKLGPRALKFENLTEEEKELYGDLYVGGYLVNDAIERLEEVKQLEESLFETVIDNQDIARAREDFDAYLAKQRREKAQGAAAINQLAQFDYMKLDAETVNKFGVRADALPTYKPKTTYEAKLKDAYLERLNTISQTEKAAALKYDIAKTYFNEKENKYIQEEFVDNWESFMEQWRNGYARGMAIEQLVMMQLGITDMDDPNDKEEAARKISEALLSQSNKQSRTVARYFNQKSGAEGWNNFKRDPLEWMTSLAANSISQMLPYGMWIIPSTTAMGTGTGAAIGGASGGVPGAIVGGKTGAVWGLRTGFAATSFAMEYGNAFIEAMESQGYNYLNPADVEAAISDEKVWAETNDRGVKRGLAIGTVDFISMGLAGRIFKASQLSGRGTALAAFAAERFTFDPFMEATGEFLAQKAVGDDIDWLEIGAEAGGAAGNQTMQAAVNVYIDQRNRSNLDIANRLANNIDALMNESASDERISQWATNMFNLGKIDADTNQKIQKNVGLRKTIKEMLGGRKTKRAVKVRLAELLQAKEELSTDTNKKNIYKSVLKRINDEISQIVETGVVPEQMKIENNENVGGTGVNLDAILGKTKPDKTAEYKWRGKRVTRQKFLDKLAKVTKASQLGKNTGVSNDLEVQTELIKVKDAIQKPSTEKVDVQEQTTDGSTVGEGNVQQESTTESVTTETETESVEVLDDTQYAPTPFLLRSRPKTAEEEAVVYEGSKVESEELYIEKTIEKMKEKGKTSDEIFKKLIRRYGMNDNEIRSFKKYIEGKVNGDIKTDIRTYRLGKQQAIADATAEAVSETTETEETTQEIFSDVELENISEELKDLEAFVKRENPKFSIKPNLTTQEKQKALDDEAYRILTEAENAGLSENTYTVENPQVQTIPIIITENSELANRVRRMGLDELVGKKINLVMADQLVTNSRYMGGPFFPLQDGVYNKVAWASMNKKAANDIIKGAIDADYTVVYNMTPNAVNANIAMRTEFLSRLENLDADTQSIIFEKIQENLGDKVYGKDTAKVQDLIKNSETLESFFDALTFDVTVKSKVIEDILPFRGKDAQTELGQVLKDLGITLEEVQESITEQFVKDLPAGVMTMVLEVQDKNGNKITEKTKGEALITSEEQVEEGLKQHPNYPVYIRGKAIGLLEETVPFWNVVPTAMETINKKAAGIITDKQGRTRTRKQQERDAMRGAEMNQDKARQTSEPTASQYARFINLLSKAFPGVEVVTDQALFDELLLQPSVVTLTTKQERTESQIIYGAVFQGKIFLNPARSNFNTPIHEFGHIWNAMAKELRPELYNKGIELIQSMLRRY